MGEWSRNRNFGLALAKGGTLRTLLLIKKRLSKGIGQLLVFMRNAQVRGVEMPILHEIYKILYDQKDPFLALSDLMSRN